jgi:uncharacterized protein
MNLWREAVIFLAALVAGAINAVAGGGTLVSYPSLVWAGLDPIVANATSTVALWPGSVASIFGYRDNLRGSRRWMIRLAPSSFIGGAVGAVLLLLTPSKIFAEIVPWLILGATALRAANAPIARILQKVSQHRETRQWLLGAVIFQFFVAVYGGYFGAGIGIMMLAAFGLLGMTDIHQMNGLKALFAMGINGIAAAYFISRGAVHWPDALPMAVGATAGGYLGARLARRLGRRFVQVAIVVIGTTMGIYLLLR